MFDLSVSFVLDMMCSLYFPSLSFLIVTIHVAITTVTFTLLLMGLAHDTYLLLSQSLSINSIGLLFYSPP